MECQALPRRHPLAARACTTGSSLEARVEWSRDDWRAGRGSQGLRG